MNLFEAFIHNPVKVSVGILIVALFGSISLLTMPKQLIPEVQNPVLTVNTRWPSASPQEIEREIILEQEEQLAAVEGLVKMSSDCRAGSGSITLEFAVGTNISDAMMRVNTRLQQVREYPIDATEPVIQAADVTDSPIARFALTARPPEKSVIEAFQKKHPDLAEAVEPARRAMNTGLRVFRLQQAYDRLKDKHPELQQLLPREVDLQEVRKLSEDIVEPLLERVPGVAEADTYGGQQRELQIIVDPERLAARQLTIADVRAALAGQNKDTSAGEIWEGKRRWVIRALGQFRDPEQVKQQVITTSDLGIPIYIGDVADVQLDYKRADSLSRRYGMTSNGISVRRASNANVLEVMAGLYQATEDLNNGILKRLDLELFQYYDETDYIKSAISLVQQNIFVGGALTFIVLMLFLHLGRLTLLTVPFIAASAVASVFLSPWFFVLTIILMFISGLCFGRGALIVGLAIPVSIVGTFLLLGLMGRSLNVISLAGLAFAVGMLVDNAVVVLENIYRRREMGENAVLASARGTSEVAGAVVASTLTTIAVFVPVLFVQETSGQLFRDIALAISCAVGLSLLVSFTMIPTAAARLFGKPVQAINRKSNGHPRAAENQSYRAHSTGGLVFWIGRVGAGFAQGLASANYWILASRYRSATLVVCMVLFSVGVSWLLWPKVEYLPSGNRNFVYCSLSPPPGYNMDQLMVMGEKLEKDLQPYWDVDPGSPEAAALKYPVIDYYFYSVRGTSVFVGFSTTEEHRVRELIPLAKEVGSQFPGTRALVKQSSLFERGITSGRNIDIEITGSDLKHLIAIGERVMKDVERILPDAQASPRPSLDFSSPEIHLYPKVIESSEMGVTAAELGYAVDAFVDGAYAGDYFVDGEKIDLTIKGKHGALGRTQDLLSIPVATRGGQVVPLSALAKVEYSSGPESILRRERLRAITISVSPAITMPLEQAMSIIDQQIIGALQAEGVIDGETMVNLSGTADKLREAWDALSWNLVLALAITYLLMAALFESWLYPLVIIFTVPLGAVGGVLGLALLNLFVFQSLDVLTMLGFVILIGTVVNNAILIVHQSLNFIREGLAPREAIPESVRTRIRPIFITTTTTVLGLLPLVLFPGAGSELYRGLGAVVLGGLVLSTAFTLFLVPAVFVLTMDVKQALSRLLIGKQEVPEMAGRLAGYAESLKV